MNHKVVLAMKNGASYFHAASMTASVSEKANSNIAHTDLALKLKIIVTSYEHPDDIQALSIPWQIG